MGRNEPGGEKEWELARMATKVIVAGRRVVVVTIKTDLQDCRVGIRCFKCAVDFLLNCPIDLVALIFSGREFHSKAPL